MSESRRLLCDTADALFAGLAAADFAAGWRRIAEAGFTALLVAEDRGGFGGDAGDLFAIMRLAGWHALPLPLGEAIVAASLANLPGPASFSGRAEGILERGRFTGAVHRVPWGRDIEHVAAVVGDSLIVAPAASARIERGANPAGEPRDTFHFEDVAVEAAPTRVDLQSIGALIRVAQIAGALDHALEMSIAHANERSQFGKPLAKFQAVQQNLAMLAAEAGAVNCAGAAAAEAFSWPGDAGDSFEIGAAKLRANVAVGIGTAIAHQVHGAIGFTREHALHRLTRRLMGWRSEFGNDAFWAGRLGALAIRAGGAGLWEEITRRSDAGQGA